MRPSAVVVPARDEQARLGRCLEALLAEAPDLLVVVDDGSTDATAAVARSLAVRVLAGPAAGPGPARRQGMALARRELGRDALLCTTDADSTVAPGWLAANAAAVAAGAGAVGGRIELDATEAAALPVAVVRERAAEAERRLAAVRTFTPQAEHHQLSGASLALTAAAHDAVGGIPVTALGVLEDEALERALRRAGIPIAYTLTARVTTSARTDGRLAHGLAQVLRGARWRAGQPDRPAPLPAPVPASEPRGLWLKRMLDDTREPIISTGPPVLAAVLRADPRLALVKATGPAHPLDEALVRPLLALGAPDLTALRSPANAGWAARVDALAALAFPASGAADTTVLVDLHARHGLGAIAEVDVDGGPQPGGGPLAYAILVALRERLPELPASSRYGEDRVLLDEVRP